MSGDSEPERRETGDEPAPESADVSAGGSPTPEFADDAYDRPVSESPEEQVGDSTAPGAHSEDHEPQSEPAPRRFRSWSSAHEPRPSLIARFAALFRRTPKEEVGEAPVEESLVEESLVEESPAFGEPEPPAFGEPEPPVPSWEAEQVPQASAESLPWIEPEPEPDVAASPAPEVEPDPWVEVPDPQPVADADAARQNFGNDFFDAPTEIIEETPKPGFFARLFGRKPKPEVAPEPEFDPRSFDEPAAVKEEPLIGTNEYATDTSDHAPVEADDAPVEAEPPRSPWAYESPETAEPRSEIEAAFDSPESPETAEPFEAIDPVAPAEPAYTASEGPFGSVDEALPAADEPTSDTWEPIRVEPVEARPGFLSRLFGRKSAKIDKKQRPSLEVAIHEDRIAAAADALDNVGQQTFAERQDEPVAQDDAFASVEEALPGPTGDERFAPHDSRPTVEVESDARPTIEVVQESRPTIEVPPPIDFGKTSDMGKAIDFGQTMDVVREPTFEDTLEVTQDKTKKTPTPQDIHLMFGETIEVVGEKRRDDADSGAYFGDTLEPSHFGDVTPPPDVIDKDTDEFAVPIQTSAETAMPIPDLDEDTAQVSRKSLIERLIFWRKEKQAEAGGADPSSTIVEGNPVFLFSKFRTFYNEIIRFKHQKTEFTAGFSTAIVTDYAADLSPEGAADSLSKNLAAMLELQAAEAMWMGGESAQRYPDAQYAMAALADETFLYQEWEGKGAFHKHLLEVKLFRSRSADVELFKRIDKLLKEQPNSPAARDLARVYLMVIAAGFKGKYRPFGLTRALADYRQRLYEYIHHGGDALMIYAPDRKIFPEATERTLVGDAIGRFTSAQRWAAILAFLVLSYTVIAHFAWSRVSADLKDVTDRIMASTSANGGP